MSCCEGYTALRSFVNSPLHEEVTMGTTRWSDDHYRDRAKLR